MLLGFTGLPHPDLLRSLMTRLNINLDQYGYGGGQSNPFAHGGSGLTYTDSNGEQQHMTPEQAQQAAIVAAVVIAVTLVLAYLVPQVVFACLYKSNVFDKKGTIEASQPGPRTMDKSKFHHDLFKCHENINEALCALLCPTVRYADAYGSIGGSYWGSLCTYFGVNTIISIGCTALVDMTEEAPLCAGLPTDPHHPCADPRSQHANILGCILRGLFFGIMMRKALRAKLGDPNPGGKAVEDMIAWAFCPCCALTQDSVEVDIALNVTVGCPCSVTPGRTGVPTIQAREGSVAPYEKLLGDAVVLEEGR